MIGTASTAGTIAGDFNVTAVNVTDMNSTDSRATYENFLAAYDSVVTIDPEKTDNFTYTGALDIGTYLSNANSADHDATTIEDWLLSGGGAVSDLDDTFGDLQLSKDNIRHGTATTTFFLFESVLDTYAAGDLTIRHDDGVEVYDAFLNALGGFVGPNGVRTTEVDGFEGGAISFLYVATNGDPSVFNVDLAPVPVPASLPLLLAGFGGMAMLRRRK